MKEHELVTVLLIASVFVLLIDMSVANHSLNILPVVIILVAVSYLSFTSRTRVYDVVCSKNNTLLVLPETIDHMYTSLRYGSEYEPHIDAWIHNHVIPGDTVIDVGAHIGYHTMVFASAVGAQGQVHAVEPVFDDLLGINLAVNNVSNVSVHKYALNADGTPVSMVKNIGSFAKTFAVAMPLPGSAAISVPTLTLDALVNNLSIIPTVVKIDVSNDEMYVLQGAHTLMSVHKPKLLLDIAPSNLKLVSELLTSYGYTLTHISYDDYYANVA